MTWENGKCTYAPLEPNPRNATANSSTIKIEKLSAEKNESESVQYKCAKIALEDIEIYENGSIFSPLRKMWFTENEYELFNETVALVCIEKYLHFDTFFLHQHYTTLAVLVISLICLTLHGVFYACLSRLRTWHGRNLLCFCCSLFVAQFLFLIGRLAVDNYGVCVFLSASLHFFWLASFCWMNILSFDTWKTFRSSFYQSRYKRERMFIFYSLYAWGVPFLIVLIALILDMTNISAKIQPHYAIFKWQKLCWINSKTGLLCFFLIPVGVIIMENLIMFILTSFDIYRQSEDAKFATAKTETSNQANEKSDTAPSGKHIKKVKVRFKMKRFFM